VTAETIRHEFIETARIEQRFAALEVADPDMARLIKRVKRKPGALKRMKVAQAIEVGEWMLNSRDGRMIQAVKDALDVDHRTGVVNALSKAHATRAAFAFVEPVVRRTQALISAPDALDQVRGAWHSIELDADQLTTWCLQSGENAMAAVGLLATRHADVLMAALNDELDLDISEYLSRIESASRTVALVEVAKRYSGPLTVQVALVVSEERDPFVEWVGITEVSDEMLQASLNPSDQIRRLHNLAIFKLVEKGVIDPWRMTRETLTPAQRKALCLAAGRIGAWDVVNSVLSQWGAYTGTNTFSGGDISNLFLLPGNNAMTLKARLECYRFCSSSQILSAVQGAAREEVDAVITQLESGVECYESVDRFFSMSVRAESLNAVYMLRRLVRGEKAGVALRDCSQDVARIIVEELREMLGDNQAAWRTALSLGSDWVGTLDELATAAKTLAK
jgi:hypothetical protein